MERIHAWSQWRDARRDPTEAGHMTSGPRFSASSSPAQVGCCSSAWTAFFFLCVLLFSGVSLDFSPSRKHSHAPQNWFRRPAHGAFRALASQRSAGLFACISLTPKLTTLCRKDQISSTAASPVSGTGRVSREYLPGKRHVKKVVSGPCKFQLSSSFSRIL